MTHDLSILCCCSVSMLADLGRWLKMFKGAVTDLMSLHSPLAEIVCQPHTCMYICARASFVSAN